MLHKHNFGDTSWKYNVKNGYTQYLEKCLRCGYIHKWEIWDEDSGHNKERAVLKSKGKIHIEK